MAHLLRGDMGRSLRTHQPVAEAIVERLPATLELGLTAIVYSLLIALPLGMVAALRRGTSTDLVATSLTLLGVSVPNFFLGIVLILVFGLALRLLPPGGYVDPAVDLPGNLRSIILPAITLGTAFAAVNMRQIRSALVETLNRDYIRTARAKGLGPAAVLTRHALRNALIPLATLVGIQVALIFEGAIITETIFFWPGIGKLVVDSIGGRDYPVVQGVVVFAALVVLLASLLVDLLYVALDPRIRFGRA
jgi:peptide/nickel transport system permease protein